MFVRETGRSRLFGGEQEVERKAGGADLDAPLSETVGITGRSRNAPWVASPRSRIDR